MSDDFSLSTIAARLVGHAWGDIHDFVEGGEEAAGEEGYSQADINDYLGRNSPNGLMDRMGASWRVQAADDPKIGASLAGIAPGSVTPLEELPANRIAQHAGTDATPPVEMPSKPDTSPPPLDFNTPEMRGHYADALNEGSVRSPQDFAERYAGSFWGALGADPSHGGAVTRSATALAHALPTDDEFTDAAIAIAGNAGIELTPGAIKQVKDNLVNSWADTSAPPMELYQQTVADPAFAASVVDPPKPAFTMPWWAADPEAMASAEASKEIEPFLLQHFGGLVQDWSDWGTAQRELEDRLRGKSIEGRALDPEGLEQAMHMAFGAMTNPIERVGAKLADFVRGMREPQVNVVTPDGAILQQPISEAVRPIEPAKEALPTTEGASPEPGQFEPTAPPAAKLQSLARDAGDRSVPMEELVRGQDPATKELARASDGASALRSFFMDTIPKVIADDSGSLRLRTPAQVQRAEEAGEGRDYARELIIRNMVGNAQRDITHYSDLLEPHYPAISKNMGEWENELAKGPGGNPMGTPIGVALDYVEGRSAGAYIDPNSPLRPLADTIRDVEQAVDKRLRQQAADGLITYEGYIKDYYPHLWTDPQAVTATFGEGTGKLGTRANLAERTTFPTLGDGIRAGYQPRFTNPIEATIHDVQGKLLYSHAADMIDEAEQAGHVYWAPGARDATDARITGGLGTRYRPMPSTTNPGTTVLQEMHAFANEGFARNMNDWLSRGLYDRPTTASMIDKLMYAKNASTAFKLALPLFHSQTVAIGSLASGIGQGLEEVARGQLGRAMMNLGKVAMVAPNLIENSVVGLRAIRRYTDQANDPAIKALTEAGLSFGKPLAPEAGYNFGTNSIYTSLRRGTLGREIAQDIRDIGGDPSTEEFGKRLLLAGLWRGPIAFPIREASRLMSLVTSPVFDTMIPALKVGASYRRMQSFLEANPTAGPDVVSKYARQVAMDVDNRLGELNLDTVFWPKAAKQAVNAATISTSWAYGTYRGLAAAVGRNIETHSWEWNPAATTSLIGTAAVYTYANAIAQYLHTGQTPFETDTPFKDFINYRTGGTIKTGAPERGMVPSELKELYDLAKVAMQSVGQPSAFGHAMVEYALAKANPFMQVLMAFATGKDGLGHDIATMPGGWARFFEENQMPIFLQQIADRKKGTQLTVAENIAGERPAAKFVADPDAYYSDLEKVRARNAKQEAYRYRSELAGREDPTPTWGEPLPAAMGRGRANAVDPINGAPLTAPGRGARTQRNPSRSGGQRGGRGRQSNRISPRGTQGVGGGYQEVGGGTQGV